MVPVLLTALLLTQTPDDSGPALALDLDYETAYATRQGDLAAERGETIGGVGTVWLAWSGWRIGAEARVATIANDPVGLAVGDAHPFIADFIALVDYRFWIDRFAIAPQLGGGTEIFAGGRGGAGWIAELGVEGTFRINDIWSVHVRFAFSPSTGIQPAFAPQTYWRFVGGVEWTSPI